MDVFEPFTFNEIIYKARLKSISYLQDTHFKYKAINRLQVKQKKTHHANVKDRNLEYLY